MIYLLCVLVWSIIVSEGNLSRRTAFCDHLARYGAALPDHVERVRNGLCEGYCGQGCDENGFKPHLNNV
jgi:hypothetical protein